MAGRGDKRTTQSAKLPRAAALQARSAALRAASDLITRYELANLGGLTFNNRRNMWEALGYKNVLSPADYRSRFSRGGIAQRVVTAYPDATWRGAGELIEDVREDVQTDFEKAWEALATRLAIWTTLSRADQLAGLGRYSVVLIGTKNGTDLSKEMERLSGPDDVIYLQPFAEDDAKVESLVTKTSDPRFGLPEKYVLKRISAERQARFVHWSRVIHIADGLLDDNLYGTPRLAAVWNYLDDLDKVIGGGAEAFWLRAHQGYYVDITETPETEIDETEVEQMRQNVEDFAHQMRRTVALRNAKMKALGSDVADFKGNADAILTVISGTTGIPKRILTGSELGELASSQDRSNWSERVRDRRQEFAAPLVIRPFADRLIQYGGLPKPEKYEVRWPMIDSLDEMEKAKLTEILAGANQKQGETILNTNEIRAHVWKLPPVEEEIIEGEVVEPKEDDEEDVPVAARAFADVDAESGQPAWKAIHGAADRHRGRIRTLVLSAFTTAAARVRVTRLASAVDGEDHGDAERLLMEPLLAAFDDVTADIAEKLRATLVGGGSAVARTIPRTAAARPRLAQPIAFDKTNPAAVAWAERRAAELVTEVTEETRAAIRAAIVRMFAEQIAPRAAAQLLRKLVGLTSRQAEAILSLRAELAEAVPGQIVKAGTLSVRVPKNGATVEFIQKVAAAYSERLIRQRALLIARTETIRASNEGQRQLWLQAQQRGHLTGRELREWIVTPDDRLCPECASMDGQRRRLDEPFEDATGTQALSPPLHPNCRCAMGLVINAEEAVA